MSVTRPVLRATRRGLALAAATVLASTAVGYSAQAEAHSLGRPPTSARETASPALPTDLRLVQQRVSLLGTHRWYQQVDGGYDVLGGWYAVHTWTDGHTTAQDGRKALTAIPAVKTDVTAQQAARRVAATDHSRAIPATTGRPMILPGTKGGSARLVWQVVTSDGSGVTASYVDAATARVVETRQLADAYQAPVQTIAHSSRTSGKVAHVTGRGRVFDPNPVVKLQDENLRDHSDADTAVPNTAYTVVNLPRLNLQHTLAGRWVRIVNANRATSATDHYMYRRHSELFEQVNAYHAIDSAQAYLRSLGFPDVNAEAQDVRTDAFSDDNSFYDPTRDLIETGTGGVDDAEDPEVVWHEYGHAVQDDQVPGFGSSEQAGAIGEGFGDYLAVTMSQATAPGDISKTPTPCVMDWDATSYTTNKPHCLRRTDLNLSYATGRNGEVHHDGQIWSRALWDMNQHVGRDVATRIIIEGQFDFTPNTAMPKAARAIVAAAHALYDGTDDTIAPKVKQAFVDRHIL